jgi:hypothetical protein
MVTRELLKKQIDCLDESYLELIYNILCQFPHLSDTASQSSDLTDDPAVGMWKEREEMQDSTEWVRQLRHMQW